MRHVRFYTVVSLSLVAIAGCRCARKSPAPPTLELPRLLEVIRFQNTPTVDGTLVESEWIDAKSTGPLLDPGDGHVVDASPVSARFSLGWDDRYLYAAASVLDAHPVSPFSRDDIDPHLWEQSSAIEIMLQPGEFADNRDYFEIQVDTHGAVWDTFFDDYNRPIEQNPETKHTTFGHQDWQSHIERKASVSDGKGYVIEMAIPWSAFDRGRAGALAPPKQGSTWRANFYSFRDGQNQSLAWSPIRGEGNFHKTSRFGKLVFQ